MGKLAYRTADDEFKTFVGFAYRQLYGDGVLGDLPDQTIDQIEELTSERIDSLTRYIDIWLESEGRKRWPRTSIAYVPVNDFKVYCEIERAGVPPLEEDRYDVMALCVLKAAKARDKEGCMKTGALLGEWVGAKSMFDNKTKGIYQHGKKDKADRSHAGAIKGEANKKRVMEEVEREQAAGTPERAINKRVAATLGINTSVVWKIRNPNYRTEKKPQKTVSKR